VFVLGVGTVLYSRVRRREVYMEEGVCPVLCWCVLWRVGEGRGVYIYIYFVFVVYVGGIFKEE